MKRPNDCPFPSPLILRMCPTPLSLAQNTMSHMDYNSGEGPDPFESLRAGEIDAGVRRYGSQRSSAVSGHAAGML